MEIYFRPIENKDVKEKVKWYNDEEITKFLHYEEKFTVKGTESWLEKISTDPTRYENIIELKSNGATEKIGIIGLFNIDFKNKKAGFYITIGENKYQGKGLAKKVSLLFLKHSFKKYELEKIYLFTDIDNTNAKKLYERLGFKQEGILRNELYYEGEFISRYYYGVLRNEFCK